MSWHTGKVDHVWHGWINAEAERRRDQPDAKDTISPFGAYEAGGKDLYGFKAMLHLLGYLPKRIGDERRKALPLVHQQCSHSPAEPLAENYLTCALGQKLRDCPILARLRAAFEAARTNPAGRGYYSDITDEQIDGVQAAVCGWHMYTADVFVDWNEGAVLDASDRMFWDRVYGNLSQQPDSEPDDANGGAA